MRANRVRIFLHLVWSTWDRAPILAGAVEEVVYAALREKARRLGVEILALGGVEDHVHVLVALPATLAPAEIVKGLKGASARLANRTLGTNGFRWQGGYGVFSVSERSLPALVEYIRRQREHHRTGSIVPRAEPE